MQIINKEKNRLPTVNEFLLYKPRHLNFEWNTNTENLVEIKVPKFRSSIGKSLCNVIKKENYFIAKLDKLGTFIWQNCDGNKTIGDILKLLKSNFPDEKNIDQRLFLFIQQMKNLNYIIY